MAGRLPDVRALFHGTRTAHKQGMLRYNIPLKYVGASADSHVKMFWDKPTAAAFFGGHKDKSWGRVIQLAALPMVYMVLFPWKYEIGDMVERVKTVMSEEMAGIGYFHFMNELQMQRNRAYEFLRFNARPGYLMSDARQIKPRQPNTMAGYQTWDQESGKPIHTMERFGKLDMFLDNDFLQKRYIEATKSDMDRIRELREKLTDIRQAMMHEKGEMYKKVME